MNENSFAYEGLTREECREKLVKDLEKANLLIKVEKIIHSVGHSERSDAVVEPYLSKQWFVKMRPLADRVLENQKNKDTKVHFVPERYEKVMNHWMEITYDWCISRQLWWGHQIPAWYKDDEIYVGMEAPKEEGWVQDPDVLDTWFSSALWPFSSLGWPDETEDYKRYYPNNLLVTGYDIIPFWVNRMTFQGLEFTNTRPFKDCLIHGLIRDKIGRKMSKSLGNGVDPMDVIEEYGADALRYYLATQTSPGMDLKYDSDKVKATWNFINKLWNASRFVLMNLGAFDKKSFHLDNLSISDKWILTKMHKCIKKVRHHMEKYEFNVVGTEIYNFVWDDFCDWYIELSKINKNENVLLLVLTNILKMLHPFMPYVTDEIYDKLPLKDETIMLSSYPKYDEKLCFDEVKDMESIIELIKNIRKVKLENNIGKDFYLVYHNDIIKNNINIFEKMLKISNILDKEQFKNNNLKNIQIGFNGDNIEIYYDNSSNEILEKENLIKEKERLEKSIERRKNLLSNENYIKKAPKNIVDSEKETLEKEINDLKILEERLSK